MSILANPIAVAARNRLRDVSLLRNLYRRWALKRMRTGPYEDRFGRELERVMEPGYVVWDVGANVGVYSRKFLTWGASRVICIEPAPETVALLRREFTNNERVTVVPVALTDKSGRAAFVASGTSGGNHLGDGDVTVELARADELIAKNNLPIPHLLKIDVEGYELEVLKGFGSLLRSPTLQAVFIEVHFTMLHERGLDSAPKQIETMLRDAGFNLRWIDLSHLCAERSR